ncbi:MAG: KH domain-containing protein [Microthrixaceae bacterium]
MSQDDLVSEESGNQQTSADGARPVQATAVLEHIARSLVETPDSVRVEVVDGPTHPRLNLYVAQGDMGRIIGKRGRMASAIRIVTRAAAARDGVEIDVEFVD